MRTVVVDASIAIKWVIEESGSDHADLLRDLCHFAAPELLVAECANILWKKVRRGELTAAEASTAARLLEKAGIEFLPTRDLLHAAMDLAIALSHPAYDCLYLALALQRGWPFVTADETFIRKVRQGADMSAAALIMTLAEARLNVQRQA